jgi:hypothetical protein
MKRFCATAVFITMIASGLFLAGCGRSDSGSDYVPKSKPPVIASAILTADDDTNTTSTNAIAGGDDNTTGGDTPLLRTLALTLSDTTLNKETNPTIELTASYDDNTTKDVTNQAEWIIDHPKAVSI